jgi:hypothetical protein
LAQRVEEIDAKKREGEKMAKEEVKQEEKLLDESVQNTIKEDIRNMGRFLVYVKKSKHKKRNRTATWRMMKSQ